MTEPSPEVTPPSPRGIVCPRCKGTKWRVVETRPVPGRLIRIRTCVGCLLQVRTREVIETVCECAKPAA